VIELRSGDGTNSVPGADADDCCAEERSRGLVRDLGEAEHALSRSEKGDFRGAVISRASLGTCKTHFRGAKGDFRGVVVSRASLGRVKRTFAERTVTVLSESSDFR
jgi:hypothetical protein